MNHRTIQSMSEAILLIIIRHHKQNSYEISNALQVLHSSAQECITKIIFD